MPPGGMGGRATGQAPAPAGRAGRWATLLRNLIPGGEWRGRKLRGQSFGVTVLWQPVRRVRAQVDPQICQPVLKLVCSVYLLIGGGVDRIV